MRLVQGNFRDNIIITAFALLTALYLERCSLSFYYLKLVIYIFRILFAVCMGVSGFGLARM